MAEIGGGGGGYAMRVSGAVRRRRRSGGAGFKERCMGMEVAMCKFETRRESSLQSPKEENYLECIFGELQKIALLIKKNTNYFLQRSI